MKSKGIYFIIELSVCTRATSSSSTSSDRMFEIQTLNDIKMYILKECSYGNWQRVRGTIAALTCEPLVFRGRPLEELRQDVLCDVQGLLHHL